MATLARVAAPLPCQRHLFALPEGTSYLNCASRSPMLLHVETAGHHAVSLKVEPWRITDDGIGERVRDLFAKLIGANAEEIALTPSTSYAISLAAHNLHRLGWILQGDVVLVLRNQMSSNVYPWQRICREVGARLRVVDSPDKGLWTDAIEAEIQRVHEAGDHVAVLAVPHFLWSDGSGPLALERLGQVCAAGNRHDGGLHRRTAFVVDATQSLGVVPIDVKACQIDWLACSVHKWLFGPYGLSCLYAAEKWYNNPLSEPLVHDEHNRAGADGDTVLPFDFEKPGYAEEFQQGSRRFDSGGRHNPILLPMVEVALKQVLAWEPERIWATLEPLTNQIAAGARQLGLTVPTHHAPHFLGIGPPLGSLSASQAKHDDTPDRWASHACSFLKSRGILVSARFGVLRVAPNIYNSIADVEALLAALGDFVKINHPLASAL